MTEEKEDSSSRYRPRIALTIGDANGIGPEVILKCISDSRLFEMMNPVVVGSIHVLQHHADRLGFEHLHFIPFAQGVESDSRVSIVVADVTKDAAPEIRFGQISAEAGELAMRAVEYATDLCIEHRADAMVTAPISKKAVSLAGFSVPGHTEFIASRCNATSFTMMLVAEQLRVGLVTGHVSIRDVPKRITQRAILDPLTNIADTLKSDFDIAHPLIAVLALNPHAGEAGILGNEEQESIIPAIEAARESGLKVFGPFPADSFFGMSAYLKYDAVLAMYHDQGLVPFKTVAFDRGVNFTAGLPIVRTSPDHGTAFDIAGEGVAAPDSMRSAIFLAVDIARRRRKMAG